MTAAEPACTGCGRAFSSVDHRRRLTVLEGRTALCGDCAWLTAHPEATVRPIGQSSARPARRWQPVPG